MRTLRIAVIIAVCSMAGSVYAQHTPLTSQYLFNGLLINPAYAGSRDALTATLTYRHQWVGFDGAPVTQTMSVHAPVKDSHVALGLLVTNDRIGVSHETGIHTNYAYRIPFRKGKLQFGLGAGLSMLQAQWTDVAIQDRSDAQFAANSRSTLRPNFSAGAYYYTKTFFVGASMPFFLTHTFDPTRNNWVVTNNVAQYQPMITAGYLVKLDNDLKLKPSTLLRYNQGSGVQADLSMNLIIKDKLWVGGSFRTNDAVVAMLEVLPVQQWRFGYAYDIGISRMAAYHRGTHEVMLQYEFGYHVRVRDPRYF
ncbi:MAG: type IX secretion system membrane protein PorP/SprF [Flavobacteriales bacterium]